MQTNAQTFAINTLAFFYDVEDMVRSGATYIDAVVKWTSERGLEIEVGAELIETFPLIKARLQMEAETLNLLKEKTARLPFGD